MEFKISHRVLCLSSQSLFPIKNIERKMQKFHKHLLKNITLAYLCNTKIDDYLFNSKQSKENSITSGRLRCCDFSIKPRRNQQNKTQKNVESQHLIFEI